MLGQKFGRLTVIASAAPYEYRGRELRCWKVKCDCAGPRSIFGFDVREDALRNGHTTSCGCVQKQQARKAKTTHGHNKAGKRKTPEYEAWCGMKQRCSNPSTDSQIKSYKEKGIIVHPAWLNSFQALYDHIGPRPSPKHSVDRIDNNGNYEPGNVRWASKTEQSLNRG